MLLHRLRRIALLGLPGSGKGTIGELLESKLGLTRVSMGDVIRDEIKANTRFGRMVHAAIKNGELVDDRIVAAKLGLILKKKRFKKGVIYDGVPRTIYQANLMEENHISPQIAVYLDCPAAALVERLSNRWGCSVCHAVYNSVSSPPKTKGLCDHDGQPLIQREDDAPNVIRKRIELNERLIKEVVEFYKDRGLLRIVKAVGTPSSILKRVERVLPRFPGQTG